MPDLLQHHPYRESQPTSASMQDLQAQISFGLLIQVVLDFPQVDLSVVSNAILISYLHVHTHKTRTPTQFCLGVVQSIMEIIQRIKSDECSTLLSS